MYQNVVAVATFKQVVAIRVTKNEKESARDDENERITSICTDHEQRENIIIRCVTQCIKAGFVSTKPREVNLILIIHHNVAIESEEAHFAFPPSSCSFPPYGLMGGGSMTLKYLSNNKMFQKYLPCPFLTNFSWNEI